jgi:hypothetical protein
MRPIYVDGTRKVTFSGTTTQASIAGTSITLSIVFGTITRINSAWVSYTTLMTDWPITEGNLSVSLGSSGTKYKLTGGIPKSNMPTKVYIVQDGICIQKGKSQITI